MTLFARFRGGCFVFQNFLTLRFHLQDKARDDACVVALDLFRTPGHWLPQGETVDGKSPLPTFLVAALEAGGPPLMSTPNVPHLVITVQDCVMVEQVRFRSLIRC